MKTLTQTSSTPQVTSKDIVKVGEGKDRQYQLREKFNTGVVSGERIIATDASRSRLVKSIGRGLV